jgi:hypothetical protein
VVPAALHTESEERTESILARLRPRHRLSACSTEPIARLNASRFALFDTRVRSAIPDQTAVFITRNSMLSRSGCRRAVTSRNRIRSCVLGILSQ